MTEEELMEKYGVVLCPHCGLLQGRTLVGIAFKYKGPFKSVYCYRCKKRIDLSKAKILFRSDSPEVVSGWIRGYKSHVNE
jgi:hypothetical protein